MIDPPIFLDGFSTLPLAPEARDKMLEVWSQPGNSGSANASGERAADFVSTGRQAVADLVGAASAEIIFTSGATEANNLALFGVSSASVNRDPRRKRILVSSIEHKAVLEPARILSASGYEIVVAPVDSGGRLNLEAYTALVDDRLLLASVMMVNNETGVIQPVAEAAKIAHANGGLFHSDGAQAAGKLSIDVGALEVDYLSLSGHKCYGPVGVGALYVAAGRPIPSPMFYGGGQQAAVRPGTEPVALIAGFGAAATLGMIGLDAYQERSREFIEKLLSRLKDQGLEFERVTQEHSVVAGSAASFCFGELGITLKGSG